MSRCASEDCVAALRARFPQREYAFFEQVANGTGWKADRWADAVAMSLWPSRGLTIWGFEVKVSKHDWKRELAEPAKSSEIQSYCDHWVIVAPTGIVDTAELPKTWGLLEVTEKGKTKFVVKPPTLKPKVVSRHFVAALLRRESEVLAQLLVNAEAAGREEGARNGHGELAARLTRAEESARHYRETIETFEQTSGVKMEHWRGIDKIGEAVKMVLEAGWRDKYATRIAASAKAFEDSAAQLRRDLEKWEAAGGEPAEVEAK